MKITNEYVFFWNGIFSNWHMADFVIDGVKYNCAEQWMMVKKAELFGDTGAITLIMNTDSPKIQKAIGRSVKDFDPVKWDLVCLEEVYKGVLDKFRQNPELKKGLYEAAEGPNGVRKFVEASPVDVVWGIGLHESAEGVEDPANWKGKNYLGQVLDRVYQTLKGEDNGAN